MIERRLKLFLYVALAWTVGVAVVGAASVPHGWQMVHYASSRWPGFVSQIIDLWVVIPAVMLFGVLAQGPLAGPLNRLVYRGRVPPPDRVRWRTRVWVVTTLFVVLGQAWQTAAIVLYWHRTQLPWVAEAVRGPHVWGLPDRNQLILRLWIVLAGLVIAWVGNGLPKLLSPFRGGHEPYDWGKMNRTCGWSMTLGGLGCAGCALLIPDLRTALFVAPTIMLGSLAAMAPIWIWSRFGGHSVDMAPPQGG